MQSTSPAKIAVDEITDPIQTAAFLQEMLIEMTRQARASSLGTLAYLLEMATLEAQRVQDR